MENKLNCIIIHGCPSRADETIDMTERTYYKHWIPWTREKLLEKGVQAFTPMMPEPWYPDYEKFKQEFEKYEVNEHTVLIGHSCGCAFLTRWLGDTNRKIKKLILVAPWKFLKTNNPIKAKFYDFQVSKEIKSNVGEIIIFTSDNEEQPGGAESLALYQEGLSGKIISLPGRGHYIERDMGTVEFPELIENILS